MEDRQRWREACVSRLRNRKVKTDDDQLRSEPVKIVLGNNAQLYAENI